ncbi:MAG: hypothetical protein K0S39_1628 [Paenibacillus sp.]|jgi:hypothetical protein|nr:hypothetical protein [Paenibacillus sp.]
MYKLEQLHHYANKINRLPSHVPLTKEDLLTPDFLLYKQDDLEMYYSPHNEYINKNSKVIVLGITPGWTQMELAYRQARNDIQAGLPLHEIARRSKQTARFAGSMRRNLIAMLDQIELNKALALSSCTSLFDDQNCLLHTTSIIKYPAFYKGRNYSGHNPRLEKSALLSDFVGKTFHTEINQLTNPFIIPLGKTVEDTLKLLISKGKLELQQCLFGFPHPSGANGHRHKQLERNLPSLKQQVREFFSPDITLNR